MAVFPLNTVVFVGATLRLQIFEQRYLELVKTCMKNQQGFVIALIRDGRDVEDTPEIYPVGTYVEIVDWDSLDHNLLGITVQGRQRVRLHNTDVNDQHLMTAEIEFLDNLEAKPTDLIDDNLVSLLQALHKHDFVAAKYPEIDYSSSIEIAYKLCELLPASNLEKQQLLETDQADLLYERLRVIINQLENLSSADDFL
ncbi:MAG: LON peptidase substrate-binding domain-containing protein [Gammaproteobacteria bacterium]|nr:LON peptidase substrate-binding domain-containing protein [Gammaproteobacteria bacterium]